MDDIALLSQLVRRGVDEALSRATFPTMRPATVRADAADAYVAVQVDDPNTAGEPATITAQNLTGRPLRSGARVMVLFQPPHGVFVVGVNAVQAGWVEIETKVLSADGLVLFQSIPQTYRHLAMVLDGRGNAAVASSDVLVRLNGDSGANYDAQYVRGVGATASASNFAAATQAIVGNAPGTSATASESGSVEVLLPNYAATNWRKNMRGLSVWTNPGGANPSFSAVFGAHWRSTAAITQIAVDFNAVGTGWKSGTVATLMGWAVQ